MSVPAIPLAELSPDQVARISDAFHIGSYYLHRVLDSERLIVRTSHGLYGFLTTEPPRAFGHERLEAEVLRAFGSRHGVVVRTAETFPASEERIPLTHKYGKYYYCIEL